MTMSSTQEREQELIPYECGQQCREVKAIRIAHMMDRNELAARQIEPGKCRFCSHQFKHRFVRIGEPPFAFDMPILQCERVAQLWQDARNIVDQWEIDRAKRRQELIEAAKGKKRKSEYEL